MIAAVLALAGAVGAAGVWFSANAIRSGDRTAVREWETRAAPVLERIWGIYRELRAIQGGDAEASAPERSSMRSAAGAARADLERIAGVPPILEPVVAEYRRSLVRLEQAVAALGRLEGGNDSARADLDEALSRAERHLREGDARRERLRARIAL